MLVPFPGKAMFFPTSCFTDVILEPFGTTIAAMLSVAWKLSAITFRPSLGFFCSWMYMPTQFSEVKSSVPASSGAVVAFEFATISTLTLRPSALKRPWLWAICSGTEDAMSGAATVTVVSEPLLPLPLAVVLDELAVVLDEPELHAASPVATAVIAKHIEN